MQVTQKEILETTVLLNKTDFWWKLTNTADLAKNQYDTKITKLRINYQRILIWQKRHNLIYMENYKHNSLIKIKDPIANEPTEFWEELDSKAKKNWIYCSYDFVNKDTNIRTNLSTRLYLAFWFSFPRIT